MKPVSKFRAGFTCPYIADEIRPQNFLDRLCLSLLLCQSSPAFQRWAGRAENAEAMKFGLTKWLLLSWLFAFLLVQFFGWRGRQMQVAGFFWNLACRKGFSDDALGWTIWSC